MPLSYEQTAIALAVIASIVVLGVFAIRAQRVERRAGPPLDDDDFAAHVLEPEPLPIDRRDLDDVPDYARWSPPLPETPELPAYRAEIEPSTASAERDFLIVVAAATLIVVVAWIARRA